MTKNSFAIRKPIFVILIIVILLIAGIVVFLLLPGMLNHGNQYCRLDTSGKLLDNCVPLFRIMNGTNDTIQFENDSVLQSLVPAPPTEECNHYAEIALKPYGGIPEDAVLINVVSGVQGSTYNPITGESGPTIVETRRISYRQRPYGIPIVEEGGSMEVEIGANGVLPELTKRWFTLEETGLIRIIPQSEVVQRLRNGQCRNAPDLALNLTIYDMKVGYYPPVNKTMPHYLEPVWIVNATDEIRGRSLQLYVPAEIDELKMKVSPDVPVSRYRNFTLVRNDSVPSDISYPLRMLWLGASGPVGKERASDTIGSFTEKSDINLTYKGRYTEQGGGGCGGVSYFWDYYEFSTPDCNFKVDTYTGTMLSAVLNTSCSNAGVRNYSFQNKIPSNATISTAVNFTRERYYHFDQRHLKLYPDFPWFNSNDFIFEGDWGLDSRYGVELIFRPSDGMLMSYTITDDVLHYACMGGGVTKIRQE
jgi:hypothetical protein